MLSHPLLVEAIEREFVPVAIHNNAKGRDAAVLKRYDEPAWNNPVVRFLSAARSDLAPRLHDRWTLRALTAGMVAALGDDTPAWLGLFAEEQRLLAGQVDTAIFAMG